jgi:hypothetical protein
VAMCDVVGKMANGCVPISLITLCNMGNCEYIPVDSYQIWSSKGVFKDPDEHYAVILVLCNLVEFLWIFKFTLC